MPPALWSDRILRALDAIHAGLDEELDPGALGTWLPRQGWELANEPVVERYLIPVGQAPVPELRTEVCVRLTADSAGAN